MSGVNEYSITPASNTSVGGIGLADSMVPTNIDNVTRQVMADIRRALNDIGAKAVSTGTDTVALTTETVYTAYADGTMLAFIAGGTCTGATTLNVDTVGGKKVLKGAGTELAAGDITAGMACVVVYDASADSATGAWLLLNPLIVAATFLANVSEDTSPTLGGALDAGGFDINNGGVIFLTEQAAAEADVAGKGQFWVETATPNLPKFTDDAGSDITLASTASVALRARIATGSYTGNGATSQGITGVGFQPKYVRIWERETSDGTAATVFETTDVIVDDNASGMSVLLAGVVAHNMETNQIIALGSDGFTVDDNGDDSDPNTNSETYNYLAIG